MIKLLQCEYKKTRGQYIFLASVLITLIQLCWALYGKYDDDYILKWGWLMFLYQFPLINAIFMPFLSVIVSSRLADIEHKGNVFKELFVITDKGKIYDAKFIYGICTVLICNIVSFSVSILFGYIKGFWGAVPIKLYLLYLLFTIIPTAVIYVFQHILSLVFKNQAVTFFAGIIGTFCGLFSMFLQEVPLLRKTFLWGYYGVLQFVGMFGWTEETRMKNVYFSVMDIDWLSFCILIGAGILMYITGRYIFCRKEV